MYGHGHGQYFLLIQWLYTASSLIFHNDANETRELILGTLADIECLPQVPVTTVETQFHWYDETVHPEGASHKCSPSWKEKMSSTYYIII